MLEKSLEQHKVVHIDEISLWTDSFGNPASTGILLIMGAACQGLMWHDAFCEFLSEKGFFVIRFDQRDVGLSSSSEFAKAPYTLDHLAQDAFAILDAYEMEKAHIVGSSMGGMIGQRMALKSPERILSLTLLSSGDHKVFTDAIAGRDLSTHTLPSPSQEFINLVRHYHQPQSAEEFLNFGVEFLRIVNGKASFDAVKARDLQKKLLAHTNPTANPLNHFFACDLTPSLLDRLKEIKVPTLIIHGEKDTLLPIEHAKKLKELIPNSNLALIHDMGHFLSENFSEEVAKLIYRHILSIKNKRASFEMIMANESNMIGQMTYFCNHVSKLSLYPHPQITLVKSSLEDHLFNYALFAKFDSENVLEKIREVRTIFEQKPFTWWVGEKDTPLNLSEHLKECGFEAINKHLGMYLELENFKAEVVNVLDFQKVESKEALEEFGHCIVLHGFPKVAFEEIFLKAPPLLYQKGAPFELYIGRLDGKTVVTGALFFQAGVAGIYYISTLPDYQKRGFATMMLEFLLQRAKNEGYFLSVLQTSQENKGIYSSLGFKAFTQITEYA